MSRVFNFCAGPASIPEPVLRQAQDELLDWQDQGTSVMEISHRSPEFIALAETAEQDLRELLAIPANYQVLFLHGGGRGQFSAAPLNLVGEASHIDLVDTGHWSKGAAAEAAKYTRVEVIAQSQVINGQVVGPDPADWQVSPDAAYVHYCPNETIDGVEFHTVPDTGDVPLVADMSSTLLSRPLDVSRFGLIYAGAQKNIGPAGLALVIVRDDLLERAHPATPAIWHYHQQAQKGSMINTPPTFAWYLAGLVFQWLKAQGGLEAMAEVNRRKAQLLYQAIDSSDFYHNRIHRRWRSWMNIPFQLTDASLDTRFLAAAEAAGLKALKGHRAVGGMRASIYNAMPLAGVEALVGFMADFEKRFG